MLEDVLAALAEARGLAGRRARHDRPGGARSRRRATARAVSSRRRPRRPYRRGHGGGAPSRRRGARRHADPARRHPARHRRRDRAPDRRRIARRPPSRSRRRMTRWARTRSSCRRPMRCRCASATTVSARISPPPEARGIEPTVVHLPGIALDIDNPVDLAHFCATRIAHASGPVARGQQRSASASAVADARSNLRRDAMPPQAGSDPVGATRPRRRGLGGARHDTGKRHRSRRDRRPARRRRGAGARRARAISRR